MDTGEEESDGKRMEGIWIKDGKKHCSSIIFPAQYDPLGVRCYC